VSFRHPKERFTRRDFLVKGAAAAAGIPAASALLAACGSDQQDVGTPVGSKLPISTKESPVSLPTFDDNNAIASGLDIEEGATLKIYNWDQYIWKKVVDDFGKKYDVKVEISTFNNMDEALSKIRSAQVDFDVFFPTIDVLGKMTQFKLLQPLNPDYLTNTSNLYDFYTESGGPFYDIGQVYTRPYTTYTTGIAWRNDLVSEKDDPDNRSNPYDLLWDSKYKGKIGIYDDYREATAMALLRNGGTDVNTGDAEELNAAKEALIETVGDVNVALTINGAYEDLPKGIFSAHQAWSGDIIAAPWYGKGSYTETAPLLSYWWPKDRKAPVGNDLMAILKGAKNPVLAHTFINYMLDFEVAMKNMSWNGYQPPQNQAPPEAFLDPKFKWASNVPRNLVNCIVDYQDMADGYWLTELDPNVDAIWHDNWEQFTAGV